ncbi:hypothetical protein SAMN04488024_101440 [Pedobacter soli]|uniref:Uncharacterized protein n=1 Tax=Pedobacter soli TaxID=390242 RepID=A0A1G6JFA0_9SPHI|nr:hypothetical protein SAMN04488024_101440 [Pedobacter soli]
MDKYIWRLSNSSPYPLRRGTRLTRHPPAVMLNLFQHLSCYTIISIPLYSSPCPLQRGTRLTRHPRRHAELVSTSLLLYHNLNATQFIPLPPSKGDKIIPASPAVMLNFRLAGRTGVSASLLLHHNINTTLFIPLPPSKEDKNNAIQ